MPLGLFLKVGGIKLNMANSIVCPAKAFPSSETTKVLLVFGALWEGLIFVDSSTHCEVLLGVVNETEDEPNVALPSFAANETVNLLLTSRPCSFASRAMLAARDMSS